MRMAVNAPGCCRQHDGFVERRRDPERFFIGLNARFEVIPVMNPDDLHNGLSGLDETIRRYG